MNKYREKNKPFEKVHLCDVCDGDIEVQRTPDGVAYWNQGHNAWPIVENGRACGFCNNHIVIPARFERLKKMEGKKL
jgi:hypothetical protein